MRSSSSYLLLSLFTLTLSSPLHRREVPQEHSHNAILASVRSNLALNNPAKIQDPVFGLLGNAAAAAGQGSVTNTDCLHQATADQAFSNAKAAGDVTGMTNALIYAALERNTGKVGLASVDCTAIKAVNKEVAGVKQHQDPASPNATALNKASTLSLAKQIASVGGDPQAALKAGTFAPGKLGDPTAKGNSCDIADDQEGCIFSQNLLVPDATPDEINAAVGDIAGTSTKAGVKAATSGTAVARGAASTGTGTATVNNANAPFRNSSSSASGCSGAVAAAVSGTSATSGSSSGASSSSTASSGGSSNNSIQTFTSGLGGPPPPVSSSAASQRPFSVNGSTFVNAGAALQRSCAIQHNACADAANSEKLAGGVAQCDKQEQACNAAGKGGK